MFADKYKRQCLLHKTWPLAQVLTPLFQQTNQLHLNADKVQAIEEWHALVKGLESSNDLKSITMWSNWWYEQKKNITQSKGQTPLILHVETTNLLIKSVSLCVCNSQNLTKLTLDGIILRPPVLRVLSSAIIDSNIVMVSLSRCELQDAGVKELTSAIKSSMLLHTLCLVDNQLTSKSAELISEALKSQMIRRQEAKYPESLRENTGFQFMERLDLDCNQLKDEGILCFCEALVDVQLQYLSVQYNMLTDLCTEAILKSKTNFDVRNNPISNENIQKITKEEGVCDPIQKTLHYSNLHVFIGKKKFKKPNAVPIGTRQAWRPAGILIHRNEPQKKEPKLKPLVNTKSLESIMLENKELSTKVHALEEALLNAIFKDEKTETNASSMESEQERQVCELGSKLKLIHEELRQASPWTLQELGIQLQEIKQRVLMSRQPLLLEAYHKLKNRFEITEKRMWEKNAVLMYRVIQVRKWVQSLPKDKELEVEY